MPVFIDRNGKIYSNGSALNAADQQKPQVDTTLSSELTSSPVFEVDAAAVKAGVLKHFGKRT